MITAFKEIPIIIYLEFRNGNEHGDIKIPNSAMVSNFLNFY